MSLEYEPASEPLQVLIIGSAGTPYSGGCFEFHFFFFFITPESRVE